MRTRRSRLFLALAAALALGLPPVAPAGAEDEALEAEPALEPAAEPEDGTSAEDRGTEFSGHPRLKPPSPAWEDETVLARVGDDVVTAGDLYYALDEGRGIDRSAPPEALKASLIEKLINQRLLVLEAYRRGYERTPPIVGHVAQLADQVAGEELRRRIYEGRLEVTEEELRELYERYHYTLRVRHISVERQDLAAELRGRILAGEDFATLARRYSEDKETARNGGDMGEVRAGRMIIHYEDVAFALEPGELSEVIKGKGEHYKLFKLESKVRDRTPGRSYQSMRADLATRVRTRKAGDALFAWQKSVLAKYEVTIDEENFAIFAHRLRDKIASWEAINAIKRDSLASTWILLDWPPEELGLDIARYVGGGLTVAEFNKNARQLRTCPTCLWRDSDVQLRQFVLGQVFDKLYILERKAIRAEHVPALDLELKRRKEARLAAMVGGMVRVDPDSVPTAAARAFWQEHQHEYMRGEQARVRRIVVGTEEEAHDIVDRLRGGADFAALAKRFSKDETTSWRGGETDFFFAGSMYGMADVALEHEPGTLIPPFKSRLGWEVVEVLEKLPPAPIPFAEVESIVKQRIAAAETERRIDELAAELRTTAPVRIDEQALARLALPS